jgi:hypothetical protein
MCVKQMKWLDDCFEIPFAHSKDAQTGEDKVKKLPRHCYCNPLGSSYDLASSLFHYRALFLDTVANPVDYLFKGGMGAQSQ